MDNFFFCSPTYFEFGKGTEAKSGELVKRFGGTKALIVYGGGSVVRSGLLDRVKKSLDEAGVGYVELGGVKPNPRDTLVYEAIDLVRKEHVDFLLAVGGGSTIDTAKAVAAGVPYDGDFWDFYSMTAVPQTVMKIGCVLTIPAAGSEASNHTVITREADKLKRGFGNDMLKPAFAIMNPELCFTLPKYQIACGATDIMAHIMERYFTNTKEVSLTDRMCEGVMRSLIREVPRVLEDPANYDAQANFMWGGTVAHNNSLGVGRVQDWASHAIEHELSALYDVPHGAGLAVIMPAWMTYVVDHDVMRFAQAAVNIWGCTMDFDNPRATALEGIRRFKQFLSSIGMPINFKELGAKAEDIPYMVEKLGVTDTVTRGFFVPLTADDVTTIYNIAVTQTV
ncbi:MAG: iron-containing alcohol dehydrogenase [Christensenellales bacterium]